MFIFCNYYKLDWWLFDNELVIGLLLWRVYGWLFWFFMVFIYGSWGYDGNGGSFYCGYVRIICFIYRYFN